MTIRKNLSPVFAVIAIAAAATNVVASTLTIIPIPPWLATTANEGRAVTPDGKYVVGVSGSGAANGYLYDVSKNLVIQPTNSLGEVPSVCTGVGYRTDPVGSQTQLVIHGLSGGVEANWMTPDGGTNWGATRRDAGFAPAVLPVGNTLAGAVGSDAFYQIIRDQSNGKQIYTSQGSNHWDNATSPSYTRTAITYGTPGDIAVMNGVAATGRAVGQKKINNGGFKLNFAIEYPPNTATAFLFAGLAGNNEGEAFSVSANGNIVFGRGPLTPGAIPYDLYGYKIINPGGSQTIAALPEFGDTGGSTSRCVPYGCSADGRFAVGMNYRGQEKAVLWNTTDANPANWTVIDLTDVAISEGILGTFTGNLRRAYSVGTNAAGNPVITGWGVDSSLATRAFVMVLTLPASSSASEPRITAITGAGTASVRVDYTNTISGSNYILQYRTNFNTTNWTAVGSQAAGGTSDFQTDTTGPGDRYYRVYYVK